MPGLLRVLDWGRQEFREILFEIGIPKAVFTIIPFAKFRAKLGSDLAFTPPTFKPEVGRAREEHRTGP